MHDVTDSINVGPGPDPLAHLLGPPALPAVGPARRRLLERTRSALRWQRRRRRLGTVAGLAACAVAVLLLHCAPDSPPGDLPTVANRRAAAAVPAPEPISAVALEWRALESAVPPAALYREAGDRYLSAEDDPASAVRCYASALDEAGAAGLAISTDDSWLLMAIKNARQKEKRDAK